MQRGAVLRLSGNGLTPISNVGMKSYFRDELKKNKSLLGTFDSVYGEYNLTMVEEAKTVSFNEGSKGWVSFKSFLPEEGASVGGKYLTALKSDIYEHYADGMSYNVFYGEPYQTTIDVLFNDIPGSVKTFRTLNYEGSQAFISKFSTVDNIPDPDGINTVPNTDGDGEYYNLNSRSGWYVSNITTDLSDTGTVEFKEKEGKWFSHIKGGTRGNISGADLSEFSVQGIGFTYTPPEPPETVDGTTIITETGVSDTINLTVTGDGVNNPND